MTRNLRVQDLEISAEEIIEQLKYKILLSQVCKEILHRQIIYQAAQERGIEVSAEEIQVEADHFRYQHNLESASATFNWLQEEMLTPEEWEASIRDHILSQKLAKFLFHQDVEVCFAQNKVRYEQALLYRIVVPYEPLVQEIFYQIEEEEISFFEAAHLYDLDERRRLTCGFEGKVSRWDLSAAVAPKVFGAVPKATLGPVKTDLGYELLRVEDFIAAQFTDEIYHKILDSLFQEWLESELNHLLHNNLAVETDAAPSLHHGA